MDKEIEQQLAKLKEEIDRLREEVTNLQAANEVLEAEKAAIEAEKQAAAADAELLAAGFVRDESGQFAGLKESTRQMLLSADPAHLKEIIGDLARSLPGRDIPPVLLGAGLPELKTPQTASLDVYALRQSNAAYL